MVGWWYGRQLGIFVLSNVSPVSDLAPAFPASIALAYGGLFEFWGFFQDNLEEPGQSRIKCQWIPVCRENLDPENPKSENKSGFKIGSSRSILEEMMDLWKFFFNEKGSSSPLFPGCLHRHTGFLFTYFLGHSLGQVVSILAALFFLRIFDTTPLCVWGRIFPLILMDNTLRTLKLS